MKRKVSQSKRRFSVIVNYFSLLVALVVFYAALETGWSMTLTVLEIVAVATAVITFFYLHVGTHLWKLVHANVEKLDEREIQVTRDSLRHSYSIFSVIALAVILLNALSVRANNSTDMVIFVSLLYLAHTLPSSIIAWKERQV